MTGLMETARRVRAGIALGRPVSPRLAAIEAEQAKAAADAPLSASSRARPPARTANDDDSAAAATARFATGAFFGLAAGAALLTAFAFISPAAGTALFERLGLFIGAGLVLTAATALAARALAAPKTAADAEPEGRTCGLVPETAVPFAASGFAPARLESPPPSDPDWRRRGGEALRFVDPGFQSAPKTWRADPHIGAKPRRR